VWTLSKLMNMITVGCWQVRGPTLATSREQSAVVPRVLVGGAIPP